MSFQTARFESALYEQPAGACTSCSRSVVLTSVGVSERNAIRQTPIHVNHPRNVPLRVPDDTADDDPSDLRLRALGDTRVMLPLATWLDLGVFGQVFAIRGRTDANDILGVSTTWGLTLDMAGAFIL